MRIAKFDRYTIKGTRQTQAAFETNHGNVERIRQRATDGFLAIRLQMVKPEAREQIAQQTDAYQSNQNLLMSDDAEINSKPQLEIYADDVKCSHGSTTGQLDEDAMFYLRARGIGLANARRVLTRAFADELVDRVTDETLRSHIEALVATRLDDVLADGEPA